MTLEEAIGYVASDELIEASRYYIFFSCCLSIFVMHFPGLTKGGSRYSSGVLGHPMIS